MTDNPSPSQADPDHGPTLRPTDSPPGFHVILSAHRSLGPTGFMVLMVLFGGVSFVTGIMFLTVGAWPVMAFFGLDVALVYLAFKLNYRAGKLHELVDLTPQALTITRIHPSGRRENFDFNPYWARVALDEWPDGRTDLRIASHGQEFPFARFLNDDERREFAVQVESRLSVLAGIEDRPSTSTRPEASNADVCWMFYRPTTKIQVRLEGIAALMSVEEDESAWRLMPLRQRANYSSIEPPGLVLPSSQPPDTSDRELTAMESDRGRENFRICRTVMRNADILYLREKGHVRARIDYRPDGVISAHWLVP